LSETKTIERN